MCNQPEISTLVNGEHYEPKADSTRGKRGGGEVTNRVCGTCIQNLMRTKTAIIPWDKKIEVKENNQSLVRRKRRKPL